MLLDAMLIPWYINVSPIIYILGIIFFVAIIIITTVFGKKISKKNVSGIIVICIIFIICFTYGFYVSYSFNLWFNNQYDTEYLEEIELEDLESE